MHYKLIISVLLIITNLGVSLSQDQITARNIFLDAEYYFFSGDYDKALQLYINALKANKSNANINYRIGLCYIKSENNKIKSIPFFQEAIKNVTVDYQEGAYKEMAAPLEAHFYLGQAYMINNQFDEAIQKFNDFKNYLTVEDVVYIDFVDQQIKACTNARTLYKSPIKMNATKISNNINTAAPNYNAVVSANETSMVLTSIINSNTQIQYSQKKNGKWSNPQNITKQIKSDNKCRSVSLSADGKELYLVKEDKGNGSIYVSNYKNGVWTPMKKLNNNINTKSWETHACVSSDGKTLYFTSNRKGSYGGLDIYKSERKNIGDSWGPARNIGLTLNSPYNEETPFITNDGNTLYFSSQGHFNIGGHDIFSSTKTNGEWSVPINIGYPLNTTDDNLFYMPVNNGEFAYISKTKDPEHKDKDIYRINFGDASNTAIAQKDKFDTETTENNFAGRKIAIKGTLSLQGNPSEFGNNFKITIINSYDSKVIDEINPEENTGYFSYRLPPGSYTFKFEGTDCQSQTKQLLIPRNYRRNEISFTTELIPNEVAAGSFFTIKNISFEKNKSTLSEEAQFELERLYNLMKNNPSLEIQVIGHAEMNNIKLSAERANSAIQYLVQKGIKENRFHLESEKNHKHYSGENLNRVDLKVSKSDQDIFVIYERPGFRKRSITDINSTIKNSTPKIYTLLLLTVSTPIDVSYFNELEGVKISQGNNNYYWYTYGEYSTYEKAKDARGKIIKYGNKYQNIFIKETKSIPNY